MVDGCSNGLNSQHGGTARLVRVQDLWQPTAGQILECYQEADNVEDNEAVAVNENASSPVLGHVPSYFNKFVF